MDLSLDHAYSHPLDLAMPLSLAEWVTSCADYRVICECDEDYHRGQERLLAMRYVERPIVNAYHRSTDGRIRSVWRRHTAGRWHSRTPNIQGVPKPLRGAFTPPEGRSFVCLDWKQSHLRIAAVVSGDRRLLEAFGAGEDIHTTTADALGVPRDAGKVLNLAMLNLVGARKVSQLMDVSVADAKEVLVGLKERFPEVTKLVKKLSRATSIDVPPVNHTFDGERGAQKVAYFWQAVEARALMKAVDQQDSTRAALDISVALVLHDELVLECPSEHAQEASDAFRKSMDVSLLGAAAYAAGGVDIDKCSQVLGSVSAFTSEQWK